MITRRAVTVLTVSRPAARIPRHPPTSTPIPLSSRCCFHCASKTWAVAHPITAHGPPPKAPQPAPEFGDRVERRQKQEELMQEATSSASKAKSPLKKRFWKDVNVKEGSDGYQVLLDTRPIRTPTRTVLTIPSSKRHLAEAIALEWDQLTSAQQALKQDYIPLTSLTSRAADIAREDSLGQDKIRREITNVAKLFLSTDTLMCWEPERKIHNPDQETLRRAQVKAAQDVVGYLTQTVWPGVEIKPILDEDTIMPVGQSAATEQTIEKWVASLPPYELAGLERAIIASKSLLIAARLVVEWGEHFSDIQPVPGARFGIDEAARASTLEVSYQTEIWGEVEDTHDVNQVDIKRQLGGVVLLISGDRG